MDLTPYDRLPTELRFYALGLMPKPVVLRSFQELAHEMDTYREDPILDTRAATAAKAAGEPFSVSKAGRAALKLWIDPLAAYLAKRRPPKGLEQVLRGLTHRQLAAMALRSILDRIHAGWDQRKKRKKVKNPDMLFRLELGRAVRNELEFAGLLAAKRWVKAGNKHARLGNFRRIDWTGKECARCGDWLWDCLAELSCFDTDDRGFPCILAEHKAALDALAEAHLLDHPLYRPSLTRQAPWASHRMPRAGIETAFVTARDPETAKAIEAAFADESVAEHAQAVSAIESVPLTINPVTLPLVKEFGDAEYKRDTAIADALLGKVFYSLIRCDFRGRLQHLCDFNYTRGDPIRALFLFADDKPIGDGIGWLEIAIANAYDVKRRWDGRHEWVARNRDLIKAVAADPGLIWRREIKAKEPFQFAAACAEYVAADTYGPKYRTRLPVWLDASSNGLQHLALMVRDAKLAAMVNLKTAAKERRGLAALRSGPGRRLSDPRQSRDTDAAREPRCSVAILVRAQGEPSRPAQAAHYDPALRRDQARDVRPNQGRVCGAWHCAVVWGAGLPARPHLVRNRGKIAGRDEGSGVYSGHRQGLLGARRLHAVGDAVWLPGR
jgi:hypothetical protein